MLEKRSKSLPRWGRDPPATLLTLITLSTHRFEINFLTDAGDIAFHVKPRFSSATVVGNAFQGGRWGQEEVSSIFPLTLGEPFEVMGSVGGRRGGVGHLGPVKTGTAEDKCMGWCTLLGRVASFHGVCSQGVSLSLATNHLLLVKRGIPS